MALIMDGQERRTISVKGTEFIEKSGGGVDLIKPGVYALSSRPGNDSSIVTHIPFIVGINPVSYAKLGMQLIIDILGAKITAGQNVIVSNPDNSYPNLQILSPGQDFSFSYDGSPNGKGSLTGTYTSTGIDIVATRTLMTLYLQSIYGIA
jgi:hypothetical protein